MSAGFYKIDPGNGELLFGAIVCGDGYQLTPDDRSAAIDGWAWYESEAEAQAAYEVQPAADDLAGQVTYLTAKVESLTVEKVKLVNDLAVATMAIKPAEKLAVKP